MEEQSDFDSHLGESRSTLPTRLLNWTSQFKSLGGFLPMQSIPFAFFHSGVIPSRFSEFSPSTFVQHLHSILSEYVPGTQDPPPDQRSDSNAVKTAASNKNHEKKTHGWFSLPETPIPAVPPDVDTQNPKYSMVGMGT